ncbi:hypothetical protein [Streptomyces sp. NPDC006879]|uniref:hypothetical protein n=1 Tax=Streptomyces sp. NPDC006879 TaxID=3364767 RepID=UPI0036D0B987
MTVSFEKAAVPTAQAVDALEIELRQVRDALELTTHDRDNALRQLGSRDAIVSNLRDALERERGEAYAAREKYGKLRADAHELLRDLVEEYDLDTYRDEISRKAEEIGLDSLEYSYRGSITVRFDFEGLRKRDGSEVTEDDVREYLTGILQAGGGLELEDYESLPGDIDLELE